MAVGKLRVSSWHFQEFPAGTKHANKLGSVIRKAPGDLGDETGQGEASWYQKHRTISDSEQDCGRAHRDDGQIEYSLSTSSQIRFGIRTVVSIHGVPWSLGRLVGVGLKGVARLQAHAHQEGDHVVEVPGERGLNFALNAKLQVVRKTAHARLGTITRASQLALGGRDGN